MSLNEQDYPIIRKAIATILAIDGYEFSEPEIRPLLKIFPGLTLDDKDISNLAKPLNNEEKANIEQYIKDRKDLFKLPAGDKEIEKLTIKLFDIIAKNVLLLLYFSGKELNESNLQSSLVAFSSLTARLLWLGQNLTHGEIQLKTDKFLFERASIVIKNKESILTEALGKQVIVAATHEDQKTLDQLKNELREAFSNGKYDLACTLCQKILAVTPNDPNIYAYLGRIYTGWHDLDAAITAYTKSISLGPSSFDSMTFAALGFVFYMLDNYKEAINQYSTSISLDPKQFHVYIDRADAYQKLGMGDKALSDLNKAIEIDPKSIYTPNIYTSIGKILERKDSKAAIEAYEKGIEASAPENVWLPAFSLGSLLSSIGKYREAIEMYTKALQSNKNQSLIYYGRAESYRKAGLLREAKADLEKLLEIRPDDTEIKRLLLELSSTSNILNATDGTAQSIKPALTFSDVAGMEELKKELKRTIVYPLTNPKLAAEFGVTVGGSVLLYGPPGCGKTFIIKAAAGEAKVKFIYVNLPDLLGRYVGETEKSIHRVFQTARQIAPCILFFDEIDAVSGKREDMKYEFSISMVDTLLVEMDGTESSNENILIVGATNVPWLIDPAFKRPGRFNRLIYVSPPDKDARKALFSLYLANKPIEKSINYEILAKLTDGFSSADIAAICNESAKVPWEEAARGGTKREITEKDIEDIIKSSKSTIVEWYRSAKIFSEKNPEAYKELLDDIKKFEKSGHGDNVSMYR